MKLNKTKVSELSVITALSSGSNIYVSDVSGSADYRIEFSGLFKNEDDMSSRSEWHGVTQKSLINYIAATTQSISNDDLNASHEYILNHNLGRDPIWKLKNNNNYFVSEYEIGVKSSGSNDTIFEFGEPITGSYMITYI